MRPRQSSPSPRAFGPSDRIGPHGSAASRRQPVSPQELPRADLSQLSEAMADVANAMIARALASPEVKAVIFDEIRAIVREELARTPSADRLMDAGEAAERLGMTEAALRKAAARGTVPCEHQGRRLRFRLSVLLGEAEARRGNQGAADAVTPPTSSTQP